MERAPRGNWEILKNLVTSAADLLLPKCCAVCEQLLHSKEKGIVCGPCWSRVRELPYPRCKRCGHGVDGHQCQWCANLPPFVRSARSFCWIGAGSGKEIVHALKYDGWTRVAGEMAERMSRVTFPADVQQERTALIPVPLSQQRLRERGFNQSGLLAAGLAERWKIPAWTDVLERVTSTRSQTRLTPGERLGNVAGAFSVPIEARSKLRGAHLIIVDDVVTTGATLRASASALFAAGTRTISYMTFGRAPSSGDRLLP